MNIETTGTEDSGFLSYGGQNSYGVNNYVFKAISAQSTTNPAMFSATAIAEPSNTIGLTDASYSNVLPVQPGGATVCKLGGYPTSSSSYGYYWKELGKSRLNFSALGSADPADVSDADVIKKIESRYNGVLNVVRMDTSAKSLNAKAMINNLKASVTASYWNLVKTDCEP